MDIRQLRYFLAIVEAGQMTRAATNLGIQQAPLSQQIRMLETELGLRLFERHPKGMDLTDAGRLFLADARRLVEDFKAMRQRMANVALGGRGTLALAFTSSVAAHQLTPVALRMCRVQYPDITLSISEDNAADITQAVAAGRLNCGLLRVPVDRPPGLEFETLLTEDAIVAIPVDHRLAKASNNLSSRALAARPVRLQELRDQALILVRRPGAPGLYANLLELCRQKGFRPPVVAEVDRTMTCLNLVAAGAGLSVVPASMEGVHPHAIVYRPLAPASRLQAPLTLVYRSADSSGPTPTFIGLLRQVAKRWRTS